MRCRRHLIAASSVALAMVIVPPEFASAQLLVFDPNNYAQNILTAARELQQVNNQIISLQNEARMLVNQARNLERLPYSSLQQLDRSVQRTRQLLGEAQRIAYDVRQIDQAFSTTYAPTTDQSDRTLIGNAQERWQNAVAGLQDAMRLQAGIVGNLDTNRAQTSALVSASQGATGALQASQAGNQLLALQAQQLADLTAVVAAQGRAQVLESSQRAAAQGQGKEQLRRFLTPGRSSQSTTVQMFH